MDSMTIEEYEKMMKEKLSEAEVQKAIMDFLLMHPHVAFVMRVNAGAIITEAGHRVRLAPPHTADIIGMFGRESGFGGLMFAIEVKRPGREPTDGQWDWLDGISKEGGLTMWADSVSDVERLFENLPDIAYSLAAWTEEAQGQE